MSEPEHDENSVVQTFLSLNKEFYFLTESQAIETLSSGRERLTNHDSPQKVFELAIEW